MLKKDLVILFYS